MTWCFISPYVCFVHAELMHFIRSVFASFWYHSIHFRYLCMYFSPLIPDYKYFYNFSRWSGVFLFRPSSCLVQSLFFGTRQLYHCFIVLSVCSSWKRLSQFSFEIDILLLALCVYVIIGYMLYEFIRPCYGYLALSTFFSLSFFLHHSWDVLAVFSVQITCCLASTMASHAVIASDLHGIRFLRTLNRTTKATHTNHMELLWD